MTLISQLIPFYILHFIFSLYVSTLYHYICLVTAIKFFAFIPQEGLLCIHRPAAS